MKTRQHLLRGLCAVIVAGSFVLASTLMGTHAAAATYYTATNGNDANPGTQALPFRTIRRGLAVLQAGDTLYIRGGTYAESINSNHIAIPTGTSWTNAPRIAAFPSEVVVLKGSYGNGINLASSYIQYVVFDGLVVEGGGISIQNGARYIRFQNGEVRNVLGQGIQGGFGGTTTTNVELINMKVHHNGDPTLLSNSGARYDHGVYMAVQNLLIDGCEIYENTGYGIHVYDSGGGNSSNTVVRNSRIYNNHGDGGVILSYGSNIQFYNNIVYGNLNGIAVNYRAYNVQIYNNTVYNHRSGAGVEIGSGGVNTIVRNNILYLNGQAVQNYGSGTVTSNNLTSDPRFVNASSGDFRLQGTSPAVDAGVALAAVTTDHALMPRPHGAAYDIGAYEFRTTAGPPAPPTNLRIVQ